MEVDTKGSNFYIITKSVEKTEFLKLPLINGVLFTEAEVIFNDFINYWKKKRWKYSSLSYRIKIYFLIKNLKINI